MGVWKFWRGDVAMRNKVRSVFAALTAIVCVCALAACNQMEGYAAPSSAISESPPQTSSGGEPTAAHTPAPTNQPPVGKGIKDADTAKGTLNAADMSDSELVSYLLSEVPEAYERIIQGGMDALITGETTELEGICRDVWLGTDLNGKFTREILYTISVSGWIYEYNPLEDAWEIRSEGSLSKLAYVKLDKVIADGLVQFLIDEVLWIDDNSLPNGYAIDNETEDWVPHTATIWTEYSVWIYVPDVGMEQYQISLDNFVEELGRRQGVLLVDITINNEGNILSISERYMP
jgi:hypothetical protein